VRFAGGIDLYFDGAFQAHLDPWSLFDLIWQNAPLGLHSILARSTSTDWLEDSVGITVLASHAPTVAITGPPYGAVFTEPADVPVHVTAQDTDGTVVQIQLTDGTRTFTSTATDFDYTFPSLAAGNYTLTATATDNTGVTASSSIYVMVLPANDNFADSFDLAQITTGNNANATREPGEPPSHSQYGSNGHSVWWHWTAPSDGWVVFSTEGSSFDAGVVIYTGNDFGHLSNPIDANPLFASAGTTYQILVDGDPGALGNIQLNVHYDVPPTVSLISPSNGDFFAFGTPIHLTAVANDSDGFVSEVGFDIFSNSSPPWQFRVNSSPYELDWTPDTRGQYTVSAYAIDNEGFGARPDITLPSAVIFVGLTVSLTTPSNGDSFVLGTSISLTAIPNDPGGLVSQVLFLIYNIGQQRWQEFRVNSSPYELDWTPDTRGQYTVTAYAIDNDGGSAGSPAITISVQ
jgi:chitinase